jgi:chitinase
MKAFATACLAVLLLSNAPPPGELQTQDRHEVLAAYFCGGCGPVSSLRPQLLTDVIYAFAEPGRGNVCFPPGAAQSEQFAALRALRAAHPALHLLISIGGWGAAPHYSDAALTAQSRDAFARTCIQYFIERAGFDGIDIDWEFPVHGGVPESPYRPQDRANATLLLRALRDRLDELGGERGRHYYLTIATPAGRWQYGGAYSVSDSYDLPAVAQIVDWFNVMTYDMNNVFSPVSAFNTPLDEDPRDPTPVAQRRWNSLRGAVRYYESHGVPAAKIVLGMAFYGRGFTGVRAENGGLYSKYSGGFPETAWSTVERRFLIDPAWQRHWSSSAQAPWLYNTRRHIFFSYDDPRSMAIKAAFVRREHLRGAMFWVFGEDDARQSLLQALEPILAKAPAQSR